MIAFWFHLIEPALWLMWLLAITIVGIVAFLGIRKLFS